MNIIKNPMIKDGQWHCGVSAAEPGRATRCHCGVEFLHEFVFSLD